MANLTEKISVRLERNERVYLERCAGACASAKFKSGKDNFSEYLRQQLLSKSGYKDEETIRMLKELKYELRKIGTNINQVTKKINGGYGSIQDIAELKESLNRIETAFDHLREETEAQWQSHDSFI